MSGQPSPASAGELAGCVAVVTGSGSGIGEASALALAAAGCDLVLNDRVPGKADHVREAAEGCGREAAVVVADVTKRTGAEELVDAAVQRFGRVDILVNVVGGIKGPIVNPFLDITEDQWDFALRLNLTSTFHCTQAALKTMVPRRTGKVVNIASIAWAGSVEHAHYAAAKAGVVALTRSVAVQVAPFNVNVNAVAPGNTGTQGMGGRGDYDVLDATGVPLGRVNEPRDIGDAVAFLCSPRARNITGQLLTVAGGLNPSL